MKTITLQSFFKMTLLLIGMTVGVGCNDSNNPGERDQEGMDIFCQLVKTVKNGVEIEYPMEIAPSLTLKKDLTFEGNAVCNKFQGHYKYEDNGKFIIEDFMMTELTCIPPYADAESMYIGYLEKISSFEQDGESIRFYFGEDSYLEYKVHL